MAERVFSKRFNSRKHLLALAVAAAGLVGWARAGLAGTFTWTGTTNLTWGTASNWGGSGPPGSGDIAQFSTTPSGTITSANQSVGAIYLATGAGNVTINDSGTFVLYGGQTISGYSPTDVGIYLTDNLNKTLAVGVSNGYLQNNQTWYVGTGDSLTIGSGANYFGLNGKTLTIDGAGNTTFQRLNNNNSYVTGTLIKKGSGTLDLTTGGFLGITQLQMNGGVTVLSANWTTARISSNIDFTGNSTLRLSTVDLSSKIKIDNGVTATIDTYGNAVTFASALTTTAGGTSTGGLTLNDTAGTKGTLTLSGANTYTGGTTVSAGELLGVNTSTNNYVKAFSTGAITLGGGTLGVQANGSTSGQDIYTGDGTTGNNVTVSGTATIDVANYNNSNTGSTIHFNTLSIGANTLTTTNSGGDQYDVQFDGATTLTGNATFNATTGNLTLSGAVGGSGLSLTKSGAGMLTLSNTANSYSGGTSITGGTAQFTKLTAMPNSGTVTINGGTLAVNVGGGASEWTITGTGAGTIAGLLNNAGGQGAPVSWAGNSALGLDTTNAASAQTYSGTIANKGTTLGITKLGSGTLVLSGTNTYTGATTVNAGTLQAGSSQPFGTTSAITVNGGVFDLNGNNVSATFAAGLAAGTITDNSNGGGTSTLTLTLGASSAFNPALKDGTGGTPQKLAVVFGGNYQVTGLNSNNNFSGGLTLTNNASLSGVNSGLGNGTIYIGKNATDNAGIILSGSPTISKNIVVNTNLGGNGTNSSTFTVSSGTNYLTGSLTLNATATFYSGNSSTTYLQGPISGSGGITAGASGWTANLVFDNETATANSYSGDTNLEWAAGNYSTGKLLYDEQIPSGPGKGNLIITGLTYLDLNGHTETINGLVGNSGQGTNHYGYVTSLSGTGTLKVGDNNWTGTYAGRFEGALNLYKIGTGTMTITPPTTNTPSNYTGTTTVSAGTLALTGGATLGSTSSLTVANNATFSYAPTTVGTALTLGTGSTLNLNDGSTLGLTWNTTTASNIVALGAATVGTSTGVTVNMSGTPTSGTAYTVLTAGSGLGTGSYYFLNLTNTTMAVAKSATSVKITPTTTTALSSAYWVGNSNSNIAGIWSLSDGATSNWASTTTGSAQALVPGSGATVYISGTGTITSAPTSTTLGANMSITGLVIQDTATGLSLNADGNALTIGTGGITMNTGVPASTISTPIILGGNQIWTNNNSANAITYNGNITDAVNYNLTLAGSGSQVFNGTINTNAGGFTFGTGSATLNGVLTVSTSNHITPNGTILIGVANALNGLIQASSATTFQATVGGNIDILGSGKTLTISNASGNMTFSGSNAFTVGNLTMSSARTFYSSITGGALTVTNLDLTNGAATLASTGNTVINAITGTNGLTITNTGTTMLSGANTSFSGGLTLTGATVKATNPGALGTGSITSANSFTLTLASGATTTTANNISFTQTSGVTETITLDAPSSQMGYTQTFGTAAFGQQGNLILNQTSNLNTVGTIAFGASTFGANAKSTQITPNGVNVTIASVTANAFALQTLVLDGTSSGNTIGVIANNATAGDNAAVTKQNSSTWTFNGANTYTGATSITGGTLTVASGGVIGSGGGSAVTVNGSGAAFNVNNVNGLTGISSLTVTQGTATLTTANNFSGATSVTGTLNLQDVGAIASSSGLTLNSGSTLQLRNNGSSNNSTISYSLPAISLPAGATPSVTIDVANNGSNTGNAILLNASSIIVTGGPNNNTYTTTVNVTGGNTYSLQLPAVTINDTTGGTGSVRLLLNPTTANISLAGTNNTAGTGKDTYLILDGTSAGNVVTGGINRTDQSGGYTYLTKSNTSTWTLQGASNYYGATSIIGGILNVQNGTALGTPANNAAQNTTVASGATLQLQNNITLALTNSRTISISGAGYTAGGGTGALENVSGTNSISPVVILGADATISSDGGSLALTNSGTMTGSGFNLTLTGANNGSIAEIIGTGTGAVTKTGAGVWTLSGANTYTGGTTINLGVLQANHAQTGTTSGPLGASGNIVFGGGTLQFTSVSSGWDPSGRIASGTSNSAVSIDTNGQPITFGTALTSSQSGGLTLNDTAVTPGSLTITKANTYGGATTVTAGTLKLGINSAIPSGSAVTVANGATLDLLGYTDTIATLALNSTSTLKIAANQTSGAQLTINSGALAQAGTLDLTNMLTSAGLYKLITGNAVPTGSFTTVTGLNSSYNLVVTGNELDAQHNATIYLALGANAAKVRTGSTTVNLNIGNTAPTNSVTLNYTLGGVSGSGTRVAGGPSDSVGITGTYTAVAGLSGNSFNITASDSNATNSPQSVAFTQTGYDYANPTYTGAALSLGKVRVGAAAPTANLAITNTTLTNASFQDYLTASAITGNSAVTASGFTDLHAGAGSSNLVFSGSTAAAGTLASTGTLTLTSTNTLSGLDTKSITPGGGAVTTTGGVYDYANPTYTGAALGLGKVRVGATAPTANLAITNTTLTNASFQDYLTASAITGNTAVTASGFTDLHAGAGSNNLVFSGNTTAAGSLASTGTLTLTSTNTLSGLDTKSITPGGGAVTTTGGVYDYANPTYTGAALSLGKVRVGAAAPTANLAITNTTLTNASFQDYLTASAITGNSAVTASGFTDLHAGAGSSNLVFSGSTAAAGTLASTGTLTLTSTNTLSGLDTKSITPGGGAVTTTGGVYDYANPTYTGAVLALGNVRVGATAPTANLAITNSTLTNASFQDYLTASAITGNSAVTASGFTDLHAGAGSNNLVFSGSTAAAGTLASTGTLTLTSTNTLSGLDTKSITPGGGAVTTTGGVYDYANAKFSGATLDFGNVHQGATVSNQSVAFGNQTVTNASFQDLLDVSATTGNAKVSATGFTGLSASSSGASTNNLTFSVNTSTGGSLASTASLTLTSNANSIAGLVNGTATVVGSPGSITTSGYVYTGLATWTGTAGNWNDFANWATAGGVPGIAGTLSANDTATFNSSAPASVTVNATPSLKDINVVSGSHSFSGSNTIYASGTTAISNGASLAINSGVTLAGTGNVTVAGTLNVGGAITQNVAVNSGGLLQGSGSVGNVSVASGGFINPGDSGKLTVDNLNLAAGGTFNWNLANYSTATPGTNFSQIVLSSGATATLGGGHFTVSFNGTGNPDNSNPFWNTNRSWTIIDGSAATSTSGLLSYSGATYTKGYFVTALSGNSLVLDYNLNNDSVLTASPINLPGVLVGHTSSAVSTISNAQTAGASTSYTATPSNGGITLSSAGSYTVNASSSDALTATLVNNTAGAGSAGSKSYTVSLANTGNPNNTPGPITVNASVYDAASITAAGGTNAPFTLANAVNGSALRASALLTSLALTNTGTTAGWVIAIPGWTNGTSTYRLDPTGSVTVAQLATGLLSGTYTATLDVSAHNVANDGSALTGAGSNDLGFTGQALTANVSNTSGGGATTFTGVTSLANFGVGETTGRQTVATILHGSTTGTTTVSMTLSPKTETFQFSDVLTMTGLDHTQFVLQMSYDPSLLLGSNTPAGALFLGYLAKDSNGNPIGWENAITGNHGSNVGCYYAGAWSNDPNNLRLGEWGVDTSGHTVWAVLDHNSDFAVIPEPTSLGLLGLGALGLLGRKRRKGQQ